MRTSICLNVYIFQKNNWSRKILILLNSYYSKMFNINDVQFKRFNACLNAFSIKKNKN